MTEDLINKIFNEDCFIGMKKLPSKSIDMVLCDLPYGVTCCSWDICLDLKKMWDILNDICKDNAPIVFTSIQPLTSKLICSNLKYFKYSAVWEKSRPSSFLIAKKQLMRYHEDISIFYKKQCTYNPQYVYRNASHSSRSIEIKSNIFNTNDFIAPVNISKKKYPGTLIKIKSENNTNKFHPTQKPLKLFEYLIKTFSNQNNLILDFCMGSGTTALACINTNRNYLGFEIDRNFYELSLKRIQDLNN